MGVDTRLSREGQAEATWAKCALIGYLTKLHKALSGGAFIEVEEEVTVLIRLRHLPNSFCTSTSVDRILFSRTVPLFSAPGAILSLLAYYQDSTVGVFDNRLGDAAQQCSSDTTLARAAHHYQPSVYLLGNDHYLRCSLSHTQVRLCDSSSSCF
jgi:hypothetical protein